MASRTSAPRRFFHAAGRVSQGESARASRKSGKQANAQVVPKADAPAPTPLTLWDHPLYRVASRKPLQGLPSTAGDVGAKASDIKRPTLSQRATFRAMMLDFRPHAPTVLGGARTPTIRYAPPVAVPADAQIAGDSTASLRERLQQLKDLQKSQVAKGDYTPYLPKASLHDKSLHAADAAKTPEKGALISADQAMSANTTLHPIARRFIIERIGANLKVAC